MHRTARPQLLVERHGAVPGTFEALEALPGVGHKTTSVVMAQAFGCGTCPNGPGRTHLPTLPLYLPVSMDALL